MLHQLLSNIARRWQPAKLAATPAERRAIARLRYQIYVEEQGDAHPDADHDARVLWSPVDDAPGSLHYYAGPVDRPAGALRVRVWAPGCAPPDVCARYGLARIPGAERVAGCENNFLMFRRSLRGTAAVATMMSKAAHDVVHRFGCHLVFATCSPGQLPIYQARGFRAYTWALADNSFGLQVPIVGATFDLDHLQRVGSHLYEPMRRLARVGRLPTDAPAELSAFIDEEEAIVADADAVEAALLAAGRTDGGGPLARLSEVARRELAKRGLIIRAPASAVVRPEGAAVYETYVVLRGSVALRRGPAVVATLGVGAAFGNLGAEGAPPSSPTAAVTAEEVSLLVLSRRALRRMRERSPEIARE
ncbi:MAG: cyclic nucleotide-binding domain-containing protein, partial [Myxococcales bacterium]|nr:cyclic nucleotide-binding domain-containing protein [Myxococcales bacterium]